MKSLHILIVEDETLNAFYLKELMTSKGHDVIGIVDKGWDAIEMALTNNPDLILMDIRLKDEINGIEAINQIHKKKFIPVIYISASNDKETHLKANATKMIGFMVKPIDEQELYHYINDTFDIIDI